MKHVHFSRSPSAKHTDTPIDKITHFMLFICRYLYRIDGGILLRMEIASSLDVVLLLQLYSCSIYIVCCNIIPYPANVENKVS